MIRILPVHVASTYQIVISMACELEKKTLVVVFFSSYLTQIMVSAIAKESLSKMGFKERRGVLFQEVAELRSDLVS